MSKQVIVVAIWDKDEGVYTRSVLVDAKTKELKMNGKKCNKVIIPESCTDKVLLRKIKSICSYDCKKVVAKGK